MEVCLVFPRFKYKSGDPPLGLAYVASALRKNNIKTSILDITFNPSFENAEAYLKTQKPDVVRVYIDTLTYNDAIKIMAIAKKLGSFVIAGGPHATIMPETPINHADVVVIGEGEKTVVDIVKNINELEKVSGIWYKRRDNIIKNQRGELIENIDSLEFPARDLLDMVKKSGYELSKNFSDFDYYSKRAFNDPKLTFKKLKLMQKKALLMFYLHPNRWAIL